MDLIKDETDVGQVVKVTYEDGVEFLNYNDVSRRVDESDDHIENDLRFGLLLKNRH